MLGSVAHKIPLFAPERVGREGEVSCLSLALVLLLHTSDLNRRGWGREKRREGGEGEREMRGKGVGRREGGITIIESSVYLITSKATATLKVAKLCNFHFHHSQF